MIAALTQYAVTNEAATLLASTKDKATKNNSDKIILFNYLTICFFLLDFGVVFSNPLPLHLYLLEQYFNFYTQVQ